MESIEYLIDKESGEEYPVPVETRHSDVFCELVERGIIKVRPEHERYLEEWGSFEYESQRYKIMKDYVIRVTVGAHEADSGIAIEDDTKYYDIVREFLKRHPELYNYQLVWYSSGDAWIGRAADFMEGKMRTPYSEAAEFEMGLKMSRYFVDINGPKSLAIDTAGVLALLPEVKDVALYEGRNGFRVYGYLSQPVNANTAERRLRGLLEDSIIKRDGKLVSLKKRKRRLIPTNEPSLDPLDTLFREERDDPGARAFKALRDKDEQQDYDFRYAPFSGEQLQDDIGVGLQYFQQG